MRRLDIIAEVLVIIGALNWGIIGVTDYNVIGSMFGMMSALTRIIYTLVGIAAIYHIFQWKAMKMRIKKH